MNHFSNKNYFTMPNEIFSLGLDASEIAVYAYLRCLESRSTYQCWPSYHPETGKRIIKNVLGKTQAECKAKLKKAIEESQSLDIGRADEYTVAAWLRTWFELYSKLHIRPSTMN